MPSLVAEKPNCLFSLLRLWLCSSASAIQRSPDDEAQSRVVNCAVDVSAGSGYPIVVAEPHRDAITIQAGDEWRFVFPQKIQHLLVHFKQYSGHLSSSVTAADYNHTGPGPHNRVSLQPVVSDSPVMCERDPATPGYFGYPFSIRRSTREVVQQDFQRHSSLLKCLREAASA